MVESGRRPLDRGGPVGGRDPAPLFGGNRRGATAWLRRRRLPGLDQPAHPPGPGRRSRALARPPHLRRAAVSRDGLARDTERAPARVQACHVVEDLQRPSIGPAILPPAAGWPTTMRTRLWPSCSTDIKARILTLRSASAVHIRASVAGRFSIVTEDCFSGGHHSPPRDPEILSSVNLRSGADERIRLPSTLDVAGG